VLVKTQDNYVNPMRKPK